MNLAIDYLIRTNLIKNWFNVPCSLFLNNKDGTKLVVTINEEINYYSIKHWDILYPTKESLPPMIDFLIPKNQIFTSPLVILPNYSLLEHKNEYISSYLNEYNHPMSRELYNHFYEQIINGKLNKRTRMNWLWKQFIRVHSINLYSREHYISSVYCSEDDIINEQRNLVCSNMKEEWQCWELWQKNMLLDPAELIFYKEYSEQ